LSLAPAQAYDFSTKLLLAVESRVNRCLQTKQKYR
jgi:hypothetical protein